MPPNFGQFFGQLGQFKRLDDCDVRWEPGADKKENLALRVLWDLLGGRRLRPIGLVPVTSRCRSSLRGRVRSYQRVPTGVNRDSQGPPTERV
jgi:hypothetical protein